VAFWCILVAAWEGQLHTLKFILLAHVPRFVSKEVPSRFFLKARFARFRSTVPTGHFSETESATGSFFR
jgi:hypothetical protein